MASGPRVLPATAAEHRRGTGRRPLRRGLLGRARLTAPAAASACSAPASGLALPHPNPPHPPRPRRREVGAGRSSLLSPPSFCLSSSLHSPSSRPGSGLRPAWPQPPKGSFCLSPGPSARRSSKPCRTPLHPAELPRPRPARSLSAPACAAGPPSGLACHAARRAAPALARAGAHGTRWPDPQTLVVIRPGPGRGAAADLWPPSLSPRPGPGPRGEGAAPSSCAPSWNAGPATARAGGEAAFRSSPGGERSPSAGAFSTRPEAWAQASAFSPQGAGRVRTPPGERGAGPGQQACRPATRQTCSILRRTRGAASCPRVLVGNRGGDPRGAGPPCAPVPLRHARVPSPHCGGARGHSGDPAHPHSTHEEEVTDLLLSPHRKVDT